MRRPPKFVQGFIDRHGKPRFYLRCAGFKTVPLPGLLPEFMAAYEEALAGHRRRSPACARNRERSARSR